MRIIFTTVSFLMISLFSLAQVYEEQRSSFTALTGIPVGNYVNFISGIVHVANGEEVPSETFAVNPGVSVTITSDQEISFEPGFSSETGSFLVAEIRMGGAGYYLMSKERNSQHVFLSSNEKNLNVLFTENFKSNEHLLYRVYDNTNKSIQNNLMPIQNSDFVNIGKNLYKFSLSNLEQGEYALEIIDSRNQKWYILFIIKN